MVNFTDFKDNVIFYDQQDITRKNLIKVHNLDSQPYSV